MFWRFREDVHASFNTKFAGKEAFKKIDRAGYLCGTINCKRLFAHRVAWAIFHGEWPELSIDHIDGNPQNNRISNLRLATVSENNRNRGKNRLNKSGYKGVSYLPRRKKWRATIMIPGERVKLLGVFETPQEAHIAYRDAADKYHGNFARAL